MKKILILLIFIFSNVAVFAQNATSNVAENTTTKLKEMFRLDDAQTKKMLDIQQNKIKSLADIEKYKNKNAALYIKKRQAIAQGTMSSISLILNTKEQKEILNAQRVAIRKAKAEKINALKDAKISELEKQMTLVELEEVF